MNDFYKRYGVACWMLVAAFWFYVGFFTSPMPIDFLWISGLVWTVMALIECIRVYVVEKKAAKKAELLEKEMKEPEKEIGEPKNKAEKSKKPEKGPEKPEKLENIEEKVDEVEVFREDTDDGGAHDVDDADDGDDIDDATGVDDSDNY